MAIQKVQDYDEPPEDLRACEAEELAHKYFDKNPDSKESFEEVFDRIYDELENQENPWI